MTTPLFDKSIIYDRETRDYAMYLDGKLVGFARTYQEGETTLNELVYELLASEVDLDAEIDASAPEETTVLTQVRVGVERFERDVAGTLGDTEWPSERLCIISTDDVEALFTRLDADDNVLWYETIRDSQVYLDAEIDEIKEAA